MWGYVQRLGTQAAPGDRVAQYTHFRDYSRAIEEKSGLTMVSLSSSTFGAHYWHKTGLYNGFDINLNSPVSSMHDSPMYDSPILLRSRPSTPSPPCRVV